MNWLKWTHIPISIFFVLLANYFLVVFPLLAQIGEGQLSDDVTITAIPAGFAAPEIGAPQNLTLTDMRATGISISWEKGASSNYTMIRASRIEYPASPSSGELIYYGDNVTALVTGFALDTSVYYMRAWGFYSDNIAYSTETSQASIGGEGMEELAEGLLEINTPLGSMAAIFGGLVYIIPLIVLSSLAFWKENAVLFLLVSGVAMMTGLYSPDILGGLNNSSPLGISIGLMLIGFSLLCCGWAFRLMFWRGAKVG